ncbi:MAG: hypothetical protein AAF683_01355 [Pseudomonadota bacterium]
MTQDQTIDVVEDILNDLSSIFPKVVRRKSYLEDTLMKKSAAREQFHLRSGSVYEVLEELSSLSDYCAEFGHDIEIALSFERASALVSSISLSPMTFNVGSQVVKALPQSRLYVDQWSAYDKPNSVVLASVWRIQIDDGFEEEVIFSSSVFLSVESGERHIKSSTRSAVRLLKRNQTESTVFSKIPLKNGNRRQARQELNQHISQELSKQPISIPDISSPGIGALSNIYSVFCDQHVIISSRNLPKRRFRDDRYKRMGWRREEGVRINKDHLIPVLKQKIESEGVSMSRAEFRDGHVYAFVSKFIKDGASFVKVEVSLSMEYRVFVNNDQPWKLFLEAYMSRWQARIKAKNCWPKCGKIIDKAKEKLHQEIPKFYFLTFPFQSFFGKYRNVRGQISSYGMIIEGKK